MLDNSRLVSALHGKDRPRTAARGSALLRLGRRQGVAAALHGQQPEHGEAHDRAPDVVLRVPVGERVRISGAADPI
jgi:hypothetical protein